MNNDEFDNSFELPPLIDEIPLPDSLEVVDEEVEALEKELEKKLKCNAVIEKVSTQKDGGYRLALDISEQDIAIALQLLKIKKSSGIVEVTFKKIDRF